MRSTRVFLNLKVRRLSMVVITVRRENRIVESVQIESHENGTGNEH